ncbi:hypothetical protein I317_00306 [Kwoniella heveanensis CBS 569]|nr:hypothetical protein I317_00306 [Kwoniella heveanensis CBS 569]
MASTLTNLNAQLRPIFTPIHPSFPFPLIDLFGAMRLSSVVEWMATGVFDPPTAATPSKGKKGGKVVKKERASVWQELVGLMVVVFGGETFLAACTGVTPSWLVSPKIALLFCLTHIMQTRTPFRKLLPPKPTLGLELLLSLPDAIGRTLLLTRFSILPILHPATPTALPATPSTLILTPFILAVPFASLIFSATNFFSPSPTFTTPVELRPGGWMMVDAWCPVVIPVIFLTLIGPVKGWDHGLGLGEDEAVVACMGILWACFAGRAVYNLGYKKEQWTSMLGLGDKKVKTE